MSPKKILVIKFRNIGDVLLTTPIFSALKTAFPDAVISTAVKKGTEQALQNNPVISDIYVLPKKLETENVIIFGKRYLKWILHLRREEFDLAINTTDGDRGIILSALIGAKHRRSETSESHQWWHRIFLHKFFLKPLNLDRHTVLRNLLLTGDLVTPSKISVNFFVSKDDESNALKLLTEQGYLNNQKLIHVHPTSRWLFKCWPDEYMAEVIDKLINANYQVVLTSAPEERELRRIQNILSKCKTMPINLSGLLSLKETGAISRISDVFFGVDTAPMHIAAAVETPVVALFGPSSGRVWGPWPNGIEFPKNPYPKKNGIQTFGAHTIIQKTWPCVPCGKDGCEGSKKSACLDCITPEIVMIHLMRVLNKHA